MYSTAVQFYIRSQINSFWQHVKNYNNSNECKRDEEKARIGPQNNRVIGEEYAERRQVAAAVISNDVCDVI